LVTKTVSFDFTPRHGTIIPVSKAETDALLNKWGGTTTGSTPAIKTNEEKGKVISKTYYQIDGKQVKKNETLNKGLFLVRTTYDTGATCTEKVIIRKCMLLILSL